MYRPPILMTGDCNRITDKTVAFLTSKSGDTAETVKAANWLKEQGVRLLCRRRQGELHAGIHLR